MIAGGVYGAALPAADPLRIVFEKAVASLGSGDYAASEQGFLAVLKAQPGNVGALGNLGVVYSRTRRYTKAIEVYSRALRIAPNDVGLNTNLGLAYLKQEQFAAALPVFQKLAADPANLQARELLANCYLSLGQLDAVVATLQPLHSGDAGILFTLGVAYLKLQRPEEAQAAFAKMMETAGPARADFLMGQASYETGQFDEAAEFFRKTLKEDAGFEGAHRELGKTLVSLRDYESAEMELRQARQDDGEALYFLGAVLAQSKQEEAVAVLSRAAEMNPDFWGPLYYLGRIRLDQGRIQKSLELLERAAKLKPDEPAIQYQLGRAFQKAGREPQARAAFERVKQLKATSLKSETDILSPARANH